MRVAIAGASGFIGKLLIDELTRDPSTAHEVIALGRSLPKTPDPATPARDGVEWRQCDLFSLLQTEQALVGADVAVYLVHSMLPTARLMQSDFEDADLLLADNFARAARRAGVRRILYMGGLIPPGSELSRHLESRCEVETALASQGCPVTTLRAGLVLGSRGSSFQMLYLLVKRLPAMICPSWTRSLTQCIDARDVIQLIRFSLEHEETAGQTYDIGGPDILSYRDLMAAVAEVMGVKRRFLYLPIVPIGLSRLWVQLITGASRNLVGPLIESLRHPMIVRDSRLLELYGKPLRSLRESLRDCLASIRPTLRSTTRERRTALSRFNDVRSIQRLPLPSGRSAEWLGREYFRWLPRFMAPLVRVTQASEHAWDFRIWPLRRPLLTLEAAPTRTTRDRQLFYIRGGSLARANQKENARLEFREVLRGKAALAAIHDFGPSIPWFLYKWTQALAHLWVMRGFRRYLLRQVPRT